MAQQPIDDKACQRIASLTSTGPQAELNDHPASLWITYSQHIAPPAVVYFLNQDCC